jgi:hypothetical protein
LSIGTVDAAERHAEKGDVLKRVLLIAAVAALASLVGSATGSAASDVNAQVDPIATVVSENSVIFQFDLYNCPAGELIAVEWTAKEPDRPDSDAAGGGGYGLSNGDRVQHLVVQAGQSSFLPGERWVGSGFVTCGEVVPVTGSGTAKAPYGN